MNKLGLFATLAQFAPRLTQVRGRTWVAVGVGLLVLFGLLIWVAIALLGWFLGQAQGWMGAAPEAARGAIEQVERVVPGMREKLGEIVPALKPAELAQRDVSGADLGPVARYPELMRTHWQQEGGQAAVEYEGPADYAAVLDHYAKGFAAQGFAQSVKSATPQAETHEYTKARERVVLKIAQQPKGGVNVRIEAALP
jgi:hypothetical protein